MNLNCNSGNAVNFNAIWTPNSYNLTLDPEGGTLATDDLSKLVLKRGESKTIYYTYGDSSAGYTEEKQGSITITAQNGEILVSHILQLGSYVAIMIINLCGTPGITATHSSLFGNEGISNTYNNAYYCSYFMYSGSPLANNQFFISYSGVNNIYNTEFYDDDYVDS